MNLIEILQYEWAIRALIASAMVGVMCGILGVFIVLRNMSLIGDALSHAILPGVVFGFMIAGYSLLGFFTGAVIAGLISAVAITWIQQNVKTKNDAAIGIVFTAMFSIGVMAISWISRNEGVHLDLQDFLFGNVLGVSSEDLYLTGFIMLYVLVSIVVFYRYLFATTFQPVIAETMGISVKTVHYFLMLLLSFAVVASLKSVGVILVVAMLITPASTALLLSDRLQRVILIAGLIGLLSAILGLVFAILFETTPGPAMAVTATLIYLLAVFFAPQKGLVFKYHHKRKTKKRILLEDTLKQAYKLHEANNLTFNNLLERLGISANAIQRSLKVLNQKGWVNYTNNTLAITTEGVAQANRLVRAHRLWETYQVAEMGLNTEQIHDDAEMFEHFLTDEMLDELEQGLGFPTVDPHGSPIPQKNSTPKLTLLQLGENQKAIITTYQLNESISTQLWQLGIVPKKEFLIKNITESGYEIEQNGGEIVTISKSLAAKIGVEKV